MLDVHTAIQEWSDGTPKSTNNAFHIAKREPTKAELDKAAQRKKRNFDRYTRKLAERGLTRADIARQQAERTNKHVELGVHGAMASNSEKAPR